MDSISKSSSCGREDMNRGYMTIPGTGQTSHTTRIGSDQPEPHPADHHEVLSGQAARRFRVRTSPILVGH